MDSSHIHSTDAYEGIAGIYFNRLLDTLIDVGDLDRADVKILDFGAGYGFLKKRLSYANCKITNYDIEKDLTEIDDWRHCDFDVMVANQVFYLFEADQLRGLLRELKEIKPDVELVVGISRQSILNNIGKVLLGKKEAHSGTRISPEVELKILRSELEIMSKKSVLQLSDVYRLRFKTDN